MEYTYRMYEDVLYDEVLPSITKLFGVFRGSTGMCSRDLENEPAAVKRLINTFIDKQIELLNEIDELYGKGLL